MDMAKYAGTAFVGLDDVKDGPMRGTIVAVDEGKFGRPVLTLDNGFKFTLNVTNVQTLIKAWGGDSKDHIDKQVELYAGETEYQGEAKASVLARPLASDDKKKKKPTAAAPKAERQHSDMDDEEAF